MQASDAMRSKSVLQCIAVCCSVFPCVAASDAVQINASPMPVTILSSLLDSRSVLQCVAVPALSLPVSLLALDAMQHSATLCNTPQHSATHCSTMQHNAARCSTLQHTAHRKT